jgi:hypothetical protein
MAIFVIVLGNGYDSLSVYRNKRERQRDHEFMIN